MPDTIAATELFTSCTLHFRATFFADQTGCPILEKQQQTHAFGNALSGTLAPTLASYIAADST